MKNERLLDAIGDIEDELISNAVNDTKTKKKGGWLRWGGIAACLAAAVLFGLQFIPQEKSVIQTGPLVKITVPEQIKADMGLGNVSAYDASEFVSGNPWNENTELTTLPVYKNPLTYVHNGTYEVLGADFDKMRERLLEVAKRLGLDTDNLTITDDSPDEATRQQIIEKFKITGDTVPEAYFKPTRLMAKTNGVMMEVDMEMTVTISFEPAVTLPDQYNYTHYAPYEDYVSVSKYLKEEYKELIGMEDPQVNIDGGDYNIDLKQSYQIEFFKGSDNEVEQIVNYSYNKVMFYCDESGRLSMVRVVMTDLSQKMGDYPVLTVSKAQELLLAGKYITSVCDEMPEKDNINKVELVYGIGWEEEYYIPYYRFYVELPKEKGDDGLNSYGYYYVPAIDSAYISNMPTPNLGN